MDMEDENMSEHTYKKRFGDRRDGRRIRTMPPVNNIMAYIMPQKNDACNYFTDRLEITEVERWLREKLEDEPASPRYIKTVYKIGYILEVEQ